MWLRQQHPWRGSWMLCPGHTPYLNRKRYLPCGPKLLPCKHNMLSISLCFPSFTTDRQNCIYLKCTVSLDWDTIPKKGNAKECSNYRTIELISHTSKVILKILQARLQQYVNCELPDVQAAFRKGRGTRDQIANIRWIIVKQKSSRKPSPSALLTLPKPLTAWVTINCGKF